MDGWRERRLDVRVVRWIDGRMDGYVEGWKYG
jgi:hypothetical protein